MTKIMLVEDDKSLREIYGVRLLAEGYDIVSAGDGELALAMAIKERPQLIISDVMMPKISGFDMLDILRSTTETRDIKVIMMTALSSEEQRARGEQLGADRYLVKSQVGIEDVVRVVHEVLGDAPTGNPAAAAQPPTRQQGVPQRTAPAASATTAPAPNSTPAPQPEPAESSIPKPTAPFSSPRPASLGERVIQPLKDNPRNQNVDINQLLDREMARETGMPALPADPQQVNEQQAQPQEQQSAPAPEPTLQQQTPASEPLDATAQFATQQQSQEAPQAQAPAPMPQPTPIQDIAPAPPIEPEPQPQEQQRQTRTATPPPAPQPAQQPQHAQLQQDISAQLDQLIAQDTANRQGGETQPATEQQTPPAPAQQQYAPQQAPTPIQPPAPQPGYAQPPQVPPRPQR